MVEISKVEEILKPYLENNDLTLYDIKWIKDFGYKILQVLVDKKGGIDTDSLAAVNDYLSAKLDEVDDSEFGEYMLEVSSPGAERELRDSNEVAEAVGDYIHIQTKSGEVYEGDLLAYEDGNLSIKINIKGRFKTIIVKYEDILKIRLAVKF